MFKALNKDGIPVSASEAVKGEKYFCQDCGEEVQLRKGTIRKHYFAHLRESDCKYVRDKDYKTEWHIRMQDYFPVEDQEVLFVDKETGEKHIADVFIPETNIVLEFQHSLISDEEFRKRTDFHVKEGRRIVWLFDESEEKPNPDHFGRFDKHYVGLIRPQTNEFFPYYFNFPGNPYYSLFYRWRGHKRDCICQLAPLEIISDKVVICAYTGLEGDAFHRVQHKTHTEKNTIVVFSLHSIQMSQSMDTEEFFINEEHWQQQSPYSEKLLPYIRWKIDYENQKTLEEIKQREIDEINRRAAEHPINPLKNGRGRFHF